MSSKPATQRKTKTKAKKSRDTAKSRDASTRKGSTLSPLDVSVDDSIDAGDDRESTFVAASLPSSSDVLSATAVGISTLKETGSNAAAEMAAPAPSEIDSGSGEVEPSIQKDTHSPETSTWTDYRFFAFLLFSVHILMLRILLLCLSWLDSMIEIPC
jgi:hypothetical protein